MKVKSNNKGFTLIELIIAISIFTVVIGLGYKIINNTNSAVKNQSNITESQLNVNLINKYVTRDLEKCKSFINPIEDFDYSTEKNYEFVINDGLKDIKYKVKKYSENNSKYYDLTRVDGTSDIVLAKKQDAVNDAPFLIEKKEDSSNIYTVKIDNLNEKIGIYTFDVSSRVDFNSSESGGGSETTDPDIDPSPVEPPVVEEKPEDKFEESYKLSYWIKDSDKNSNNVLMGILHPGQKQGNDVINYEKQGEFTANSNNEYNISMNVNFNNAGKHDNMSMNNGMSGKLGGDNFQTQNLKKTVDTLVIEVGKGTKFKLLVNDSFVVPGITSDNEITLESGIYTYKIIAGKLSLKGTIIKESSNSYVNICYGKGK